MLSLLLVSESPEPAAWRRAASCLSLERTRHVPVPKAARHPGSSEDRGRVRAQDSGARLPGHDPFPLPRSPTPSRRQPRASRAQSGGIAPNTARERGRAVQGTREPRAFHGPRTWRPGPSLGPALPRPRRPIPGPLASYLHTPRPTTCPRPHLRGGTSPRALTVAPTVRRGWGAAVRRLGYTGGGGGGGGHDIPSLSGRFHPGKWGR